MPRPWDAALVANLVVLEPYGIGVWIDGFELLTQLAKIFTGKEKPVIANL